MTNLKKSLALVVAMVMLLGMVSIAGAFSDVPSDYDYLSETEMLSDLGILSGYPDGTFKPDATITRAEACAVIYRMLSGKTAASNFNGATAFSDVAADNWASGYVNYCSELGIVMGYPDGTFLPNKPVSFAEFCTMLVRALGLDTGKLSFPFGYLAVADMNKVTDSVDLLPNDAASRGSVAKLAYNAIMNATYARIATDDNEAPTIAEDVLKLKSKVSVVEGINGYGFGADDGEIKIVDGDAFEFDKDSSLLGTKVKVWFKGAFVDDDEDKAVDKFDKVYAVVPQATSSVTLNMASIDWIKAGTYEYNSGDDEIVMADDARGFENMAANGDTWALSDNDDVDAEIDAHEKTKELMNVKFVDINDDDEYDLAFLSTYVKGKVERVTSSKIYIDSGDVALTDDGDDLDVTYPSGLKKDDRVLVYTEADKDIIYLVPKSTDTLKSLDADKNPTIGSTEYKLAVGATEITKDSLGKSFDFYVDPIFGYIVEDSAKKAADKVFYVKAASDLTTDEYTGDKIYKIKAVLPDGTATEYTLADDTEYAKLFADLDDNAATPDTFAAGIYKYDFDDDDNVVIKDGDTEAVGEEDFEAVALTALVAASDDTAKKSSSLLSVDGTSYSIASDSVLYFVVWKAGKVDSIKAYTGTLPSFVATNKDHANDVTGAVVAKDGTSFRAVKYALVSINDGSLTAGNDETEIIGYVSSVQYVTDGDGFAAQYEIAANGDVKTYLGETEDDVDTLDKITEAGDFVNFDINTDGRISRIDPADVTNIYGAGEVLYGYAVGENSGEYDFRCDDEVGDDEADDLNLAASKYWSFADDAEVYVGNFADNEDIEVGITDDMEISDFDAVTDDYALYKVWLVLNDDKDIVSAFVSSNVTEPAAD